MENLGKITLKINGCRRDGLVFQLSSIQRLRNKMTETMTDEKNIISVDFYIFIFYFKQIN